MDELEWTTEGLAASVARSAETGRRRDDDRAWRDALDRTIILDPVSSSEAVAAANMAARLASGAVSRASLRLVSDTYRDVDRTTQPLGRRVRRARPQGVSAPWNQPDTQRVVDLNEDPPEAS